MKLAEFIIKNGYYAALVAAGQKELAERYLQAEILLSKFGSEPIPLSFDDRPTEAQSALDDASDNRSEAIDWCWNNRLMEI